ncbi:MAG: peptide-methionine (S)-S-oxide reductase MsrA, partial [Pseudomonadota bacterium]
DNTMKLTHPLSIALFAGGVAALATFFLSAGAEDGPNVQTNNANIETAIFAGGCFWCVESDFDKVDGVLETVSGYTGGNSTNPTYKSHTKDGHLEAVRVVYDSSKVEYGELVDYFLRHIDPTDDGGQFCDRGNSYRTAVFVDGAGERSEVETQFAAVNQAGILPAPIVTRVLDETTFYEAERYHQNYYQKNPARYKLYRVGCGRDKRVAEVWSGAGNS